MRPNRPGTDLQEPAWKDACEPVVDVRFARASAAEVTA